MIKQYKSITVICILVLNVVPLVIGFSEHLEAAEEEHQFDDRTHLDVFGESAKEFLTKRVVCMQGSKKMTIRHP
jgi:hypothetical protein